MLKTFAVILLLAASPALADQSTPTPGSTQDPYKKLFAPQRNLLEPRKTAQPSIDPPAKKPKVVCGMTIIPANPKFDPKMAIPRKSDGIDYTIRAIDPPICNPAR